MTDSAHRLLAPGPFTADQLREESRYELVNGHLLYCEHAGGRHSASNLTGGAALWSDPAVTEAGVDAGYQLNAATVRAPDVAVGHVPNAPGWVAGAPPLAVEYADRGQDEGKLRQKVAELLAAGTRYLWVVRLVGLPRVEVHEAGKAMRVASLDELLTAPGVLRNPVPVRALFERDAARALVLRNLLSQYGYDTLDDVRDEGHDEGRDEGLRAAVLDLCEVFEIELTAERRAFVEQLDRAGLDMLRARLKGERRWPGIKA